MFSEPAMLDYGTDSSTASKQQIAQNMANEVSQQWFGDLVTHAWWDEVWLSEGYGKYYEYHALAMVSYV
jgi:aminopeptidase N